MNRAGRLCACVSRKCPRDSPQIPGPLLTLARPSRRIVRRCVCPLCRGKTPDSLPFAGRPLCRGGLAGTNISPPVNLVLVSGMYQALEIFSARVNRSGSCSTPLPRYRCPFTRAYVTLLLTCRASDGPRAHKLQTGLRSASWRKSIPTRLPARHRPVISVIITVCGD